jgi:ligand-binding sensor domain-containing protein
VLQRFAALRLKPPEQKFASNEDRRFVIRARPPHVLFADQPLREWLASNRGLYLYKAISNKISYLAHPMNWSCVPLHWTTVEAS